MSWALKTAAKHPDLKSAVVNSHGEWLDFLLDDGRTFRFRPGALIKSEAPEEQRTALLNRLITIGIDQAEPPKQVDDGGGSAAGPANHSAHPAGKGSGADAPGGIAGLLAGLAEQQRSGNIFGDPAKPSAPTDGPMPLAEEPDENTPVVPIVRAADYFLPSHRDADSIVYLPLTDFLAVGLAHDMPETIQPIYYSQLQDDDRELGEIMTEAVVTLRKMSGQGRQAVEIGVTEVAGAQVMTFLQPANYELSWFADLDMMQQIAERVAAERPDDIPLFVPASKTKLFIVFSSDPHLVDFFKLLLTQREAREAVYPLPHTVAADGWKEWVPFPGDELSAVLGSLRNHFRGRLYAAQVEALNSWGDFGAIKEFMPRRLKSGERVSTTVWAAADGHGSIPHTDYLTFLRDPSPHPWEEQSSVRITIRSHVAREVWPEGFTKSETAWPPRWDVNGFPDDDTLIKLRDSADRQI